MIVTEGSALISSTDVEATTRTLTAAFAGDPVLEWIFPLDTAGRAELMDGFFRVTTELLLDHHGSILATSGHESVVVLSPPGEPDLTEQANEAYLDALAAATGSGGERSVTCMRLLDEHAPAGLPEHWHVMFAGTRPEQQLEAVRAGTTKEVCALFDAHDVAVYAEASSKVNLTLWRWLGAHPLGAEIPLPGGPSLHPIWRPSASSRLAHRQEGIR
ncbi:hypothetical protein ACWED2_30545 [Amycolatopsis sp. NPDC005003]